MFESRTKISSVGLGLSLFALITTAVSAALYRRFQIKVASFSLNLWAGPRVSAKTKEFKCSKTSINIIRGDQRRLVTKYEVLFRDRKTFIFLVELYNNV